MVMRKRQVYGSNGFQVHSIPRAPRSIRRRKPQRKMVEDNQICAFELLASLAGKLLQESESSSTSSYASGRTDQPTIAKDVIKQEQEEEMKPVKVEYIEQASGSSDKVNINGGFKSEMCESMAAIGNSIGKVEVASPDYEVSCIVNIENEIRRQQDAKGEGAEDMTMAHGCSSKGSVDLCVNSNSDAKLPLCMDPSPTSPFGLHKNNVSLCNRDDDETFSRHIKPISKTKSSRPPSRIGDRRIRKLLTSKYWKVAPKLKDCEMSKADWGMKSVYRKRKTFYHRERSQHDMIHKRRKLFHRGLVVTSDGGFSSESVSNSPERLVNGDKNSSATKYHNHKDSHVKFSIQSFEVPELFIEVPETTTVGSLKRTVMEAVTAILGGGLRVGVVLQGKKIGEDNRTLLQTGISSKDNIDSLGFTLEHSAVQVPPPIHLESLPSVSPCDAPPIASELELEIPDALPDAKSPDTLVDQLGSNNESSLCHTDVLTDNSVSDSRALVPVPAINMETPLAVIPVSHKPRRNELVRRRTRRPFSVTEVEALVEAVEQLGSGRWRDVKLRSFENADHRTYVDLKDKWKTLVHTAQIAPQQRRGEPVPQELLDRVLAAHGYWALQQAKQHGKQHVGVQNITEAQVAQVGAEGSVVKTV